MNDFVDRLLGRIDAPPIRPLVPTLFEPASPVGAEPVLPMGTFTESPPKPLAAKETERVRAAPVPMPGEPATTTHEIVAESRTTTEHTTVLSSERLIESSLEREVRTEQVQRETVSQPVLAAEPAIAPVPPDPPAAAKIHVIEPVRAHPVARPRPEAQPPPRRPSMPRRQNAPAEPDVHISIGRVEVTAPSAAPVPAPKPQKERKPLLSLDDYLRERG